MVQCAPLDQRAGTPTATIDHLFVGQHRIVDGVPVHHRFLAVGEAFFQEFEEEFLLVAIVLGLAGSDFARPVIRQADGGKLLAHRSDVLQRPDFRMHAALNGGILGRQAEGVPPHRVEHIVALRPLEPRHHIAQRVVAYMPHMDITGWVGEHFQHEIIGFAVGFRCFKNILLLPCGLPTGFGVAGVITCGLGGHKMSP